MRYRPFSLAVLGASLLVPAHAAGVAQPGELRAFVLAASCAACHGPDGHSPGAIPSLAGKSARFIEFAMQEYKSGASAGTVMNRIARGYSDDEIRLIATRLGRREEVR